MPWPSPPYLAASPAVWQAAGAVAVAVVTAAVTYLLGRRTTSGSVETSAASDLWAATDSLRKDLASALEWTTKALADERAARVQDRIRFEADLQVERAERIRLEGALRAAEEDNRELRERVALLENRTSE